MVAALLPPGKRVGVLTISRATLSDDHLKAAGVPLDTPIVGTDNGEIWRARSESAWIKVTDGLPAVLALAAV